MASNTDMTYEVGEQRKQESLIVPADFVDPILGTKHDSIDLIRFMGRESDEFKRLQLLHIGKGKRPLAARVFPEITSIKAIEDFIIKKGAEQGYLLLSKRNGDTVAFKCDHKGCSFMFTFRCKDGKWHFTFGSGDPFHRNHSRLPPQEALSKKAPKSEKEQSSGEEGDQRQATSAVEAIGNADVSTFKDRPPLVVTQGASTNETMMTQVDPKPLEDTDSVLAEKFRGMLSFTKEEIPALEEGGQGIKRIRNVGKDKGGSGSPAVDDPSRPDDSSAMTGFSGGSGSRSPKRPKSDTSAVHNESKTTATISPTGVNISPEQLVDPPEFLLSKAGSSVLHDPAVEEMSCMMEEISMTESKACAILDDLSLHSIGTSTREAVENRTFFDQLPPRPIEEHLKKPVPRASFPGNWGISQGKKASTSSGRSLLRQALESRTSSGGLPLQEQDNVEHSAAILPTTIVAQLNRLCVSSPITMSDEWYYSSSLGCERVKCCGPMMTLRARFNFNLVLQEVEKGNVAWVKEMLEDVNATSYCNLTALHVACYHEYTNMVLMLLKNGADMKIKVADRPTLEAMVDNGKDDEYYEAVPLLASGLAGHDALSIAKMRGNDKIVKILSDHETMSLLLSVA